MEMGCCSFGLFYFCKINPPNVVALIFGWFTSNTIDKQNNTLGFIKLITFYAIVGATTLLLFLPFFSMEFLNNYSKTVGLWFGNFEFNASVYYLARAIGYAITGYNEIAIIGKILPLISVFIILGFTFFKKNTNLPNLITSMLLVLTLYFFLSTTVHPWYIATLIILSVFTNYKFPLVWSW
eukprot:TRINITY_DN873_c0_g1_i2.p1 TRINITY_DN873_c0_g1~~TRINITY_DN873_c0_g1_i2.p1  ORF type:complete len:181 (-),score=21.55 TRINITY_DN873_c0_g1_i2:157-699(-)